MAVKYTFVVTIYNDGYLAEAFCRDFLTAFQGHLERTDIRGAVELIFVNDGSTDDSLATLRGLARTLGFVRVIDLSRNFGQHPAILCGYHEASGQYVGRLNVDMQDPPAEIPKLLTVIENEDVDLVIGLQRKRRSHWLDIISARLFFWVFNALTGAKIPQNTTPLRVMNRRVVDAFKRVNDKFPFMQGLESWFGFAVRYVPTEHRERADGRSSYTLYKRWKLAMDAAISFSDRPLKATVSLGLTMAALGFLAICYLIVLRLTHGSVLSGWSSIIATLLLCFGIQVLVVGLCGLYLGKILTQVQDRPPYLIRERIGFPEPGKSATDA
jgi:glycosyltransferase involved in cell wall biosynthesis